MPPKIKKRPLFQSPNNAQNTGECSTRKGSSNDSYGKSIKRKCKRLHFSPAESPSIVTQCNTASPNTELPVSLNHIKSESAASPLHPPTITASTNVTDPVQTIQSTPYQCTTTQLPAVSVQSLSFDNEDLLFGLCPEDLSFTLNNSMLVECAKTSCSKATSSLKQRSTNELFNLQSDRYSIGTECKEDKLISPQRDANFIDPSTNQELLDKGLVSPLINAVSQSRPLNTNTVKHSTPLSSTSRYYGNPTIQAADDWREDCGKDEPLDVHEDKIPRQLTYPEGTFYGLPLAVKVCLKEHRGIETLYDWQHTCLCLPSVIEGTNLIYSLPTSGGKTLVAELIIFQKLLVAKKDVLFILPFVSIVQEKVRELSLFATSLGFAVEEYAASKGRIPPRNRRKKCVVYVATIEKASGLVNSLIEMERINSLGLVVVDELHMIGDGTTRGATLEICLTKVLQCSVTVAIQIVGMSATLSNIDELAQFLKAVVYSNDFRPVELLEYVKLGRCIYTVNGGRYDGGLYLEPGRDILDDVKMDPDQLCSLVAEVIPHASCLVFCATKKNCQNVALLLAKYLPRDQRIIKQTARQNLLKFLSIEAAGVCPILAQTIPSGIAYHHSGLTADERRIIEEGYLEGTLCLLACTSTLAAGVNLPAKRVILRSPFIGNKFLSKSQYKQMIGRAGRSGLCEKGESILILKDQEKHQAMEMLFSGSYDNCTSSLLNAGSSVLMSLMLSLIGLKVVKTFVQLKNFLQCTLFAIQNHHDHLEKNCEDALTKLVEGGYITVEMGDSPIQSSYRITSLGRATYKGCLPAEQASTVYNDLLKGQQGLVLTTDLHLLFLTTPSDLCTSIQPNWMIYFEMLTNLDSDELKVAEIVGVNPGVLSKKATGISGNMSTETQILYHRFYISLILHYLLKTTSSDAIWRTANYFQCSRGFIQNVMNTTASFAACLTHFTQEIPELWSINLLLPAVTKKLAYSASLDLVPLMEITGVKQGRARQLVSAGISTPQQLAAADVHTLCDSIDHLYVKQAKKLIQAAKRYLSEQAEVLMEEAEELMSLVPTLNTVT